MTELDLFSDMTDESDKTENDENLDETEPETVTEPENGAEAENGEDEDESDSAENVMSRPTVSEVPEGAVSVTDFAMALTFLEGNPYGYVLPQEVYQAVKAKKKPLASVLVKTEDANQPRVYVLKDEAMAQWAERAANNEGRGSGAGKPGSKRSADELREAFTKEDGAVWRLCYANERRNLWDGVVTDRQKTVEKYHRWMTDAGISVDEIADLIAETKKSFDAAEQAKIEEREAKKAERAAAKKAETPETPSE